MVFGRGQCLFATSVDGEWG